MNRWNPRLAASAAAALLAVTSRAAMAEDAACASRITRANVVPCALRASLPVRVEREAANAVEGRYRGVSALLPSNPVLSLSGGRRAGGTDGSTGSTLNWYASLAQEVEVAGQRGARQHAVDQERIAQSKRVALSEREAALGAVEALFEVVADDEQVLLAKRLEATSDATAVIARARAESGLLSSVEADVAEAAALRQGQVRRAAERRASSARGDLAVALALDPRRPPIVQGDLTPLSGLDAIARASATHPAPDRLEVQALDAERGAFEARADAFRRTRVPNPTVSVFVQNDGFNERVYGAGIALPIPLPGGVGRTYGGEIEESEALGRRRAVETEQRRRETRLELLKASNAYESRRREVEAYRPERLERAEHSLTDIATELQSGRLALRDVLLAQQALIEMLVASVEARRALALASVELARAAGLPLERGAR
jgi:outer membrane protein, heavy metal efflux system